jgi:hypothetical protein
MLTEIMEEPILKRSISLLISDRGHSLQTTVADPGLRESLADERK